MNRIWVRRLLVPLLAGLPVVSVASLSAWAQKAGSGQELRAAPAAESPGTLPGGRAHAVRPSRGVSGRVYSATPRGLLVSDDDGQSWVSLPVDRAHDEVFSVALHPSDPGVLFVGRRDGLWRTDDGGKLWAPVGSPTTGPYVPLAVAIAETQPNVLYVATARHGVLRSTDGGHRWTSASRGLPEARGGGRTEEIRTLVVDPLNADVAYAAHERHGVYRTTDGGASWRPFNEGLPVAAWRPTYPPKLAFDPDDPGRLYLVFAQPIHSRLVKNRLYVTSDSGRWVPVEADLPANTPIVDLTVDQGKRALRLWTPDKAWELPLPGRAGTAR